MTKGEEGEGKGEQRGWKENRLKSNMYRIGRQNRNVMYKMKCLFGRYASERERSMRKSNKTEINVERKLEKYVDSSI